MSIWTTGNPIPNHHTNKTPPVSTNSNLGTFRCPSTKCKICNYLTESSHFKSTQTGKTFKINHRFNCKSRNIIYLVTCKLYTLKYVGETGCTQAERVNRHTSCIQLRQNTRISLHFNSLNNNIRHFTIMAIEQNAYSDKEHITRLARERY